MKCSKEMMLLYAVTDSRFAKKQSLLEQIEAALKGGVTCLQLREKNLDDEKFLQRALQVKQLCKKYHVPFIINDNVDVAIKCQADGIHVGQDDMDVKKVRQLVGDKMMIGLSVQTLDQALLAKEVGANYLGVGTVFNTTTKEDAIDVSYETLKQICQSVDLPVVAIGGINKENMHLLKGSAIDGVALVSAIFSAENIEDECKQLLELAKRVVNDD